MLKVLVVEDNEMNRDVLSRWLQMNDYEVICAEDGHNGVLLARDQRPDIILMDVDLPDIDGWEVIRRIKLNPALCRTPVIAVTAFPFNEFKDKAKESKCDDFHTKPVDFDKLKSRIDELCLGSINPEQAV